MFRKIIQIIIRMLFYLIIAAIVVLGLPRLLVTLYASPLTYTPQTAPKARVAVVFGAGLQRDGTPSVVLRDRVAAAADLYKAGKVEKILMSGDNRFIYYNEPGAMLEYALDLGIPREAIVLDYAGRRTYDTCYRARDIFKVNEVLLVTQNFHLPRALFTCNALGVAAYGVSADRTRYQTSYQTLWEVREVGATLAAVWDVWLGKPEPVLGNPEPIFSQALPAQSSHNNSPHPQP